MSFTPNRGLHHARFSNSLVPIAWVQRPLDAEMPVTVVQFEQFLCSGAPGFTDLLYRPILNARLGLNRSNSLQMFG